MSVQATIVHGWTDAAAALAAVPPGSRAVLMSAPDAGSYAGAGWFAALAVRARAEFPAVDQSWILDCGDAPGHVLAALRAGVAAIVFTGAPALRARLEEIAAAHGATILAQAPGPAAKAHPR